MRELQALELEFPELISPDSPTQRVGDSPISVFGTVQHELPMLSLGNAFSEDELREFNRRVVDRLDLQSDVELTYAAEPKLDGAAVSLLYIDGVLVRTVTQVDWKCVVKSLCRRPDSSNTTKELVRQAKRPL
jgi:DNA ligase (NAD+)